MTTQTIPELVLKLIAAVEQLGGGDKHRRLITQSRNAISEHLIDQLASTGAISAAPGRTGAPRRHDHAAIVADAQRGLTVSQIAKERGVPATTVRYVLTKARRAKTQ